MKRFLLVLVLLAVILVPAVWAAKPVAPQDNFRFVVLADRANSPNQKAFEMVLRDIERMSPDFVVTVGDLIQGYKDSAGTVKDWDSTLPYLKLLSCPVYLTPGNHDITTPEVRNIFIKKTGRNPYYSFDYQNSHFIILDNTLVGSADKMDPDQMKWLEKDLKALKAKAGVYIFMHKPFWAAGVGEGKPDRLHDLFKKYKVTAVFAGHWHNYASEVFDGIRYVVMGSSGAELRPSENVSLAAFYQYLWITVKDGIFNPALVRAGSNYDVDYVSLKEETFAHKLPSTAVFVDGPSLTEGKKLTALEGVVRVRNLTEKPLKTEILWESSRNWQNDKNRVPVEIAPGDSLVSPFKFKGTGPLYPLPLMKMTYYFGRDKYYTLESNPSVTRVVECPKAKKAPEIDGNIDDSEWWGAAKAVEFCDWDGNSASADPTQVYFMYDAENLYVAAVCHDTAMAKLKAAKTLRDDPVYNDDCIGFLFAPNKDTVYQMYVNPVSTIWDQLIDNTRDDMDVKWNGGFLVKCANKESEWTMEMKVPLKDIGLQSLDKKSELRMNIRRKQQRNNQSSLWMYDWSYLPKNFGIVRFK